MTQPIQSKIATRRVLVTVTGTNRGRRVYRDVEVDLVRIQEAPFSRAKGDCPAEDRIFVRSESAARHGLERSEPMLIVSGSIREVGADEQEVPAAPAPTRPLPAPRASGPVLPRPSRRKRPDFLDLIVGRQLGPADADAERTDRGFIAALGRGTDAGAR